MRIIDLSTYPRRSHYEFFKSYAYPYMGITANVDVTNMYNAAKAMGGSPFLAFLWAAATAANSVPELRQRIVDDQIVEYDFCPTAHTVALPDGTFVNCQTDCRRSFADFQAHGKQCQEEAKGRHGFVQPGDDETRLIFVSSTPWITFTQVTQPTPMPADSNVRIVFGKFFDCSGRKLMPVNIQCNHALVDGLHVAEFFRKFQELADSDLLAKQQPVPASPKADWRENVLQSDNLPLSIYDDHDKMKAQGVFCSQYRREQIRSVTFQDTLRQMPEGAWDVSEARNRSVMAWVRPNGALYDLYIGAEGGMQTGENCEGMFAGYVNVERVTFGSALHTKGADNMYCMFAECRSLTELDLSGFDTSCVQDTGWMFSGCMSLTKLDLSSFDTSGVRGMSGMFERCTSVTALDLSSFDTSGVEDMRWMFCGCTSLPGLDLSSFDTSEVGEMNGMFEACTSLTELDLSSFDTSEVEDMSGIFDRCPAGSKWKHLLH